ncbi:MAG: hypothetical protein ACREFY_14400, partial [Acetobacteraceae bacterium]
ALFGLSHFVGDNARLFHLMPTITDNLHLLGAGPSLRTSGQAVGALIAIVCVWLAWRRGTGRLPAAALLAGTFLATPYAFFYDLPILTCAVLDFVLERVEARGAFTALELMAVLAAVLLPIPMVAAASTVPWSGIVLPLMFALIVRRALCALPKQRAAPAGMAWHASSGTGQIASQL